MAMRANIFNENFLNEADQDANTVLIELDKGSIGLRSAKIGEQCEAIIRFPKLFEKYPFPILINSSFLKLAELFRIGSNLSRLWILRVCQQSEKHLEKIVNVEEFVKRIFMVIHSNDPVARALTLRTIGAVACVIPEKEQVHHAIRNALDSSRIEIEAAIFASVNFAAQSKIRIELTGTERAKKCILAPRNRSLFFLFVSRFLDPFLWSYVLALN
ncbi:integrator complex subunit 7 isoform X1 [Culex pipiens pallens]|uniref:integrator complex subunit 7 isoform X1 n=1 Tax=Culex pipiens pallens TaxID=42434 RepID=UPI001952FA03|nr:integrator complex subunit 7 isoform X1 [Culex pipiens pallens]